MRRLFLLFFTLLYSQVSVAQDTNWGLSLGSGIAATPHYMGDDDYALNVLPYVRVSYDDIFYASVPEGINIKLYKNGPLTFTANTRFVFAREEDGRAPFRIAGQRTKDLIGLGDIDTSWELGGQIRYDVGRLSLKTSARQAISGHEGFVGEVSANYNHSIRGFGPPIRLSAGPSLKFGNSQYMGEFFGVTTEQSTASRLNEFSAKGGLYSVGLSLSATAPVTHKSALFLQASVSQLTGDAKDAPLVKERGKAVQAFGGLFWVYSFGQDARRGRR